jgi:hypothetical protein
MKLLKSIFLCLIVALLTSCASNDRLLSVDSFVNGKGTGLVLISFDDRNLFGTSGMFLVIESEKGIRHQLATSRHKEMINTTSQSQISFAAHELKPGVYKILEWELFRTESGKSGPHPKDKLSFEVKADEIVYIGDLKVIRVQGSGIFSDQFERDKSKFLKYFPFLEKTKIVNRAVTSSLWPMSGGK